MNQPFSQPLITTHSSLQFLLASPVGPDDTSLLSQKGLYLPIVSHLFLGLLSLKNVRFGDSGAT